MEISKSVQPFGRLLQVVGVEITLVAEFIYVGEAIKYGGESVLPEVMVGGLLLVVTGAAIDMYYSAIAPE